MLAAARMRIGCEQVRTGRVGSVGYRPRQRPRHYGVIFMSRISRATGWVWIMLSSNGVARTSTFRHRSGIRQKYCCAVRQERRDPLRNNWKQSANSVQKSSPQYVFWTSTYVLVAVLDGTRAETGREAEPALLDDLVGCDERLFTGFLWSICGPFSVSTNSCTAPSSRPYF